MSHQLVQEVLKGVPQSEEDRLEILKWAIILVRGKEEHQEENPDPEKNHDNNSLQWSAGKEPNNQLSDRSRSTGRPLNPTESTFNNASVQLRSEHLNNDNDHLSPAKRWEPKPMEDPYVLPDFDPA